MRLDFSRLASPPAKPTGHDGTPGTLRRHADFARPGQRLTGRDNTLRAPTTTDPLSRASHLPGDRPGQRSVSRQAGVPPVPGVPSWPAPLSPTPRMAARPQEGDPPGPWLPLLQRFRFDLVEADIAAGHPADDIHRVNNMAWDFIQHQGMDFAEAIRAAAAIVATCQVAECEAAYEDVRKLWHRVVSSGTPLPIDFGKMGGPDGRTR